MADNKEFRLGVGEAHEFELVAKQTGWTSQDFNRLVQDKRLCSDILDVLRGQSEIKPLDHMIDCDADPFCPDGLTVEEHKKGGQFQWDSAKVSLYLSKKQKGSKRINGHVLRQELEGQPVLNANVLDYLIVHPELIPDEWKGKYVFFWGTIYRDRDGGLYVRYLDWLGGGRWFWGYGWLDNGWRPGFLAMVRAS